MTGYVFCFSECCSCKRPFSYNPNLVPSIRVNGVREPMCGDCVARANPARKKLGLEPIRVLPGAYEPCKEGEL